MKAAEWIDRAKLARGWTSDYLVSKELGITRGALSQIRTGKTATLGDEMAIKVAHALGERPEAIIIDQAAERVKVPEVRAALLDTARRLCVLC